LKDKVLFLIPYQVFGDGFLFFCEGIALKLTVYEQAANSSILRLLFSIYHCLTLLTYCFYQDVFSAAKAR